MGLDDKENCMSPPHTEAGGEPLEPGGLQDVDCKKWTSLKNYVDALLVAKPVMAQTFVYFFWLERDYSLKSAFQREK